MSRARVAPQLLELAHRLAEETDLLVATDPAQLFDATDADLAQLVLVWPELPNPIPPAELDLLRRAQEHAPFVLVSALDADRSSQGEWSHSALISALEGLSVATTLSGHMLDHPDDRARSRLLVVAGGHARPPEPRPGFRAAALVHVRNEADVLPEVLDHLASEGVEVHVFDNWSTDGTWEHVLDAQRRGVVREVARFPAGGPADQLDMAGQLREVQEYAARLDVDWVMLNDADEIRTSPWPGTRIVDVLGRIDALGYSAASFTVADFRFVEDDPEPLPPFERSMVHYELGRRPGHFIQVKAWKNVGVVDLATTGGHNAAFEGRRTFPLKMLLKHYPLRGRSHARRKVFEERLPRWRQERSTHGWHVQYDRYAELGDVPAWSAADLERWDEARFLDEMLVERLTGIGLAEPAPGRDVERIGDGVTYADGAEDRLLRTLQDATDVSSGSDELLEAIVDWPTRYHLSPQRANLLKPLALRPGLRVLDVGAGTGALARHLGEQGCLVTALEGSPRRAQVAAERCRDLDGVDVVCGTIDDLPPDATFDLICIIGVLEYTTADIGGAGGPERLLEAASTHLASGGAVALAIENQLGLKYLMGGAEDHRGRPWVGIEDYPGPAGPRTWSRRELRGLFASAGLPHVTWLASYPDYKLPSVVVHERTFDRADAPELVSQLVVSPVAFFDQPPVRIGDAGAAHAVALRAGIGLEVASSYLAVATKEPDGARWVPDDALAWVLAGHRVRAFRRDRVLTTDGQVRPLGRSEPTRQGWLEHVAGDARPFVEGATVGTEVEAALRAHDRERLGEVLRRWSSELRSLATPSPAGTSPTGPYGATQGRLALPPQFLDASPSNFVISGESLVLIDDEWRVPSGVDLELAIVRALWILAHSIVTSGIAHPWDLRDSVGVVFGDLVDWVDVDPEPEVMRRFVEAEVELQQLVARSNEAHLRGEWLNPDRTGIDARPDELIRVRLEDAERERDRLTQYVAWLEEQRQEMEGQRDHFEGVAAGHERDLTRMRSFHGWLMIRGARSRVGRRLRRR